MAGRWEGGFGARFSRIAAQRDLFRLREIEGVGALPVPQKHTERNKRKKDGKKSAFKFPDGQKRGKGSVFRK